MKVGTMQRAGSRKTGGDKRVIGAVCAFICLLIALFLRADSWAQQPERIARIGYMMGAGSQNDPRFVAFKQDLGDLGHINGKNVAIEFRSAEGRLERIPGLVSELVQLKLDVLVISGQPGVRAAKNTTKTIPIVMLGSFDPVATRIVDSLAHPGGNFTGITNLGRDLSGKRLELLKEANPRTSRVGVVWNPETPGPHQAFKEYEAAARALKMQLQPFEVRTGSTDFESVFREASKGRVNALITARNSVLDHYRKQIAELAIKLQVPSMCERPPYVEAGCLMAYLTDEQWSYRRAAYYVDRILKGAKPADLPVEQPTKFELVVNLKTAKQIGLAIPPNFLARADRVIK